MTLNNLLFPFEDKPIPRFIKNEDQPYDPEEIAIMQQRHREFFDGLDVTKKIRELTTPKFLGLDRRIYEGRFIDHRFRNKRQFAQTKYGRTALESSRETPAIDISLEEVQMLVFDYITKISQQQQFSEDFKQKIFSQSFLFIQDHRAGEIPTTEQIAERNKEVLLAIENLGINTTIQL